MFLRLELGTRGRGWRWPPSWFLHCVLRTFRCNIGANSQSSELQLKDADLTPCGSSEQLTIRCEGRRTRRLQDLRKSYLRFIEVWFWIKLNGIAMFKWLAENFGRAPSWEALIGYFLSFILVGYMVDQRILDISGGLFALLMVLYSSVLIYWVIGFIFSGSARSRRPTPQTHVKCPDCRELVLRDARKCKHCGCSLIPQ